MLLQITFIPDLRKLGTFLRLQVHKRVGFSRVDVFEKEGKYVNRHLSIYSL